MLKRIMTMGVTLLLLAVGIAWLPGCSNDEDGTPPEAVVLKTIEAYNDRDLDALADNYDPEIVHILDATLIGFDEPEEVGIQAVLAGHESDWADDDATIASVEVVAVEDSTVTTTETLSTSWISVKTSVLYEISDQGQIVFMERTVEEVIDDGKQSES